MVEMLMYDSQHTVKSCENLNFLSYHSVFTFLRTILLSFWITGSLLNQCNVLKWRTQFSSLQKPKQKLDLQFWAGKFKFSQFYFMLRITATWIWDKSTFSSTFPKQYDSLFDNSHVLSELWTRNCLFWFALLQNNFMFSHLTKHVNQHCCALEILKKISICLVFI